MGLRDGELVVAGMNFTCLLQPLMHLEVPDRDCAFTLLAKALGYAIVLASTIVKAPQVTMAPTWLQASVSTFSACSPFLDVPISRCPIKEGLFHLPATCEALCNVKVCLEGLLIIVPAPGSPIQIYIILKNKSVQGLSAASFEMELVGFTIALSYCFFKKIPFSAYGELLPLLVQGLILVGLVYRFSPKLGPLTWLKAGVYCAAAPPLLSGNVSEKVIDTLFACQHAIFFLSRFPQIIENFRNKSTGQLSFATSFMNLAGCLGECWQFLVRASPSSSMLIAPVHKHSREGPGNQYPLFLKFSFTAQVVLGACLGIITHGTVFSQILMYSKPAPKVDKVGDKKSE
eukprot:SM000020S06002  [mRNA]  locus=s20:314658:316895:- [translate_table: standard]